MSESANTHLFVWTPFWYIPQWMYVWSQFSYRLLFAYLHVLCQQRLPSHPPLKTHKHSCTMLYSITRVPTLSFLWSQKGRLLLFLISSLCSLTKNTVTYYMWQKKIIGHRHSWKKYWYSVTTNLENEIPTSRYDAPNHITFYSHRTPSCSNSNQRSGRNDVTVKDNLSSSSYLIL